MDRRIAGALCAQQSGYHPFPAKVKQPQTRAGWPAEGHADI